MTVLLTGWTGQALSSTRSGHWGNPDEGARATRRPDTEIGYTLRRDDDRTIRLGASCDAFALDKTVQADGRTEVTVSCSGELVSIVAAQTTIVISSDDEAVIVNVNGGHDRQLARVRALLAGSNAARAVRTLATVLEEAGTDAPEKMGVRLTGALLGQIDGEPGAVRRLSRELQARYSGTARRPRSAPPHSWAAYQAGVIKAAGHLETCLDSFYFTNPMRQVSSFVWIHQVERLWFEYLSCQSLLLR